MLWLTRPGAAELVGPEPVDETGPIAPRDAVGHDHLWFLDRMTRTTTPLVERMTLIWHDWFATSNAGVGQQSLLLDQNELFRRQALGSYSCPSPRRPPRRPPPVCRSRRRSSR